MTAALTDYRVMAVQELGPRGGLTPRWDVVAGEYHKIVASFTTKGEALDELATLVNEAHAARIEFSAPRSYDHSIGGRTSGVGDRDY